MKHMKHMDEHPQMKFRKTEKYEFNNADTSRY